MEGPRPSAKVVLHPPSTIVMVLLREENYNLPFSTGFAPGVPLLQSVNIPSRFGGDREGRTEIESTGDLERETEAHRAEGWAKRLCFRSYCFCGNIHPWF